MKKLIKGKFGTVLIILVTLILAGVAIFTAFRLYQLRQESISPNAPSSNPRAAETVKPVGTATNNCSLSFTLSTSTPTPTATPTKTTPVVTVNCDTNTTVITATVTWLANGQTTGGYTVEVNDDSAIFDLVSGHWWNKTISSATTTKAVIPTGFVDPSNTNSVVSMPALGQNKTYYVRVHYGVSSNISSTGYYSNIVKFNTATCATPTPTATSTATASPTETPNPSGTPNSCGGTCGSNSNCSSGLYCYNGYCRNPSCSSETDCSCPGGSSSSTSTPTSTSASLPVSGTNWPTVTGVGVGVLVIIGSIILAL